MLTPCHSLISESFWGETLACLGEAMRGAGGSFSNVYPHAESMKVSKTDAAIIGRRASIMAGDSDFLRLRQELTTGNSPPNGRG
jgi:hypothetical protein